MTPAAWPVVLLAFVGLLVWLIVVQQRARPRATSWYCPTCGTVGDPVTRTQGAFLIEVVLWCCFLVPGLIYSLWRLSSKQAVCPRCGAPHMIPSDSPRAIAARAK